MDNIHDYIWLVITLIMLSLPITHIFFLCWLNELKEKLNRMKRNFISMNKKKLFSISLIGILVLLPIIVFVWNFYSHSFSDDISKWGAFGDYIGGVYSVYISIGLYLLSRKLGRTDERRNKQRFHIEKLYGIIRSIGFAGTKDDKLLGDFVNEIAFAELYLSDELIKRVIDLQDNFAEATDNISLLNIELESEVLSMLKLELKRI